MLDGKPTLPASIKVVGKDDRTSRLEITVLKVATDRSGECWIR